MKSKTKLKRPARFVRVDRGHGLAENWTTAKVIDQRECAQLFSTEMATDLLVELPGGERVWVSSWSEISDTKDLKTKAI